MLGDAALASAELTASIGDSRYYASRYATTGDEAEIERAHATLTRAKERLATTRTKSAEVDRQAVEAMDWLRYQVEGFESELAALENSVHAYGPSTSGNSLATAINISGEQLAEQARGVEQRLARSAATTADALAALNRWLAMIVIGLLGLAIEWSRSSARASSAGPPRARSARSPGR